MKMMTDRNAVDLHRFLAEARRLLERRLGSERPGVHDLEIQRALEAIASATSTLIEAGIDGGKT
jgi:hypothetical protein